MITQGYDLRTDPEVAKGALEPRSIYLAGQFFNDDQVAEVMTIEMDLSAIGASYFSPRLECRYNSKTDPPIVAQRSFALNRFHISMCDLVVASLTYPDVGTAWELGFADAIKKPRLGVSRKERKLINLMVVGTVDHLIDLNDVGKEVEAFFADIARYGRTDAYSKLLSRSVVRAGIEME